MILPLGKSYPERGENRTTGPLLFCPSLQNPGQGIYHCLWLNPRSGGKKERKKGRAIHVFKRGRMRRRTGAVSAQLLTMGFAGDCLAQNIGQ
jgi:hypothetical protein